MKKIFTLTLAIILSASFVCASTGIDNANFKAVEKQLTKNANISGDFEQTRYIQGLDKPLKSSGTFAISSDDGLLWKQTKPFDSTMKATKDRLENSIMDNPPTVVTKEQQPMIFTFTQVFMSVFQGNTKDVQNYFDIDFTGDINSWSIELTPKSSPLNKAIKNITLKGAKTIEQINVADAQDNVIDIKLTNITVK